MRYIYLVLLMLILKNLNAIELYCDFEEVYLDGSTQQGFFLIKDDKMRYEYLDEKLFIIFRKSNNFYLVEKNNKKQFQRLRQNNSILNELVNLMDEYPDFENEYFNDDYRILIEASSNNSFLKRIAFFSDTLTLSIYFNNCSFESMYDPFFRYDDPIKYYRR